MFKKGFNYYFDIGYILFLFLHFIFFLPYVLMLLPAEFGIDTYIDGIMPEDIYGFYIFLFMRNDLDVYFTLISIWFLYVISDRFVQSRKKNTVYNPSDNINT